jgi:hypothetical protein
MKATKTSVEAISTAYTLISRKIAMCAPP